jgi:uncharacterized protein YcaQ
MITATDLRARAVAQALFSPTTLPEALARLGFVQADPIRAPARAQDLILRPRVDGYRAGELERRYDGLEIEEDYLYAYGFVSRPVFRLLHPRRAARPSAREQRILAAVERIGPTHPSALEAEFGRKRVINAWGGYSKETTHTLERLHHRGLLRVSGRLKGVRLYQTVPAHPPGLSPRERLGALMRVVAQLLAPVPEATLRTIAFQLRKHLPGVSNVAPVLKDLVRSGALERHTVDGIVYLWPPDLATAEAPDRVCLLAPFDPLVWDRRRFEHLWGWSYRFEAYTPVEKRVRGYYALPLLWRDRIIGWANVQVVDGQVRAEVGFVDKRPGERAFARALEEDLARLSHFLDLAPPSKTPPRRPPGKR